MMRGLLGALLALLFGIEAHARTSVPSEITDGFYVTLDEVRANSRATFEAFAGPSGGPISKRQFTTTDLPQEIGPSGRNPELLDRLFGKLDQDGNGELTYSEWREQIEKDLSFADANDDGRITLKELSNARENIGFGDALGMLF